MSNLRIPTKRVMCHNNAFENPLTARHTTTLHLLLVQTFGWFLTHFSLRLLRFQIWFFKNGHITVSKSFQIHHPLPWSAIHWNCLQLSHIVSHSPNLSSQKAYIRFESNVHLKLSWDLSLSRSELDISSVHGIMGLSVLTSANYIHITFPAYSTSAKKTSKSIFHVNSSSWQIYHLIFTLTHSQRLAMILFSRTHRTQKQKLSFSQ